ncbi:hypothetical protein Srufu_071200 [Streptomyces libani subsp. rufus]|nr:hypothetical protein Srufu_071200 [Streptomyces libani subsp. rufus]
MRILLIAGAFNSLTQRVYAELGDHGHQVSVELVTRDTPLPEAVRRHAPELIVAPMLKTAIPREVWSAHICLIVHPGPVGDQGPSSLDWAVHLGADRWGVTVLQANDEMDGGDIWAAASCPVPGVGKSDLYRNEIADAAVGAVLAAVARVASGTHRPQPQGELSDAAKPGRPRPRSARTCAGSTGTRTPPTPSSASCAPPTPSPAYGTNFSATPGICTVATRRTP